MGLQKIVLKITDMHCPSCSLNVDGALEETPGVISARTSYAKAESVVIYEPTKIGLSQILSVIKSQGYAVQHG